MSDKKLSTRLYPTRIDIPAEARKQIVGILNQTLAASLDLKTQVNTNSL
jgi:starvation-inducible DNA-binding protein